MKISEHLRRSFFTVLVLLIFYGLISWIANLLIDLINQISYLLVDLFDLKKNTAAVLSVVLIMVCSWILGFIPIRKIIFYIFRKRAGRIKKDFFCARIKNTNFLGGYHIGVVTKEFSRNGKKYYNVVFNIAGLMTVPNVPEEDIERVDMTVADWALLYFSFGVL